MATEAKPASKRYRVENRDKHRSRWVFELTPAADGDPTEIVLGDPADRSIPDAQRTKLTSSPELVISDEEIARMTRGSRRAFDALVKAGQIELRPL